MLAVAGNRLVAYFLLPGRIHRPARAPILPRLVVVRPKGRVVRLDAAGSGPTRLGFVRLAALPAQGEGLVHEETPDLRHRCRRHAHDPRMDSCGQPSQGFMNVVNKYPGQLSSLAWGVVVVVIALLCSNSETRDSLLGHGKALSLVSLGVLLLLLTMTIVGWSLA